MPAATRDPTNLPEESFPRSAPVDHQLRYLLRYAIMAPSVRNTQPWRFAVRMNTVSLFADLERRQPVSDPDRRELYISLGCALENLLIAAEWHGLAHEVTYFPEYGNEELVVQVAFAPGGAPSPSRAGITLDDLRRRHNDNSVYRPVAVPAEIRRRLDVCREEREPRLDLTDDRLFRRWVDELTVEADRVDFADPIFRKELGYWIGEGAFGTGRALSRFARLVVTRIDLAEPVARQDGAIVESAALLGIISAKSDTHLIHVRTGQLFERLWLTATGMGIDVHPMSQTTRVPTLRSAVGELLPSSGWIPQHLFRVGYSSHPGVPSRRTPRRPVPEVLLD
jgi:hypothetical protein